MITVGDISELLVSKDSVAKFIDDDAYRGYDSLKMKNKRFLAIPFSTYMILVDKKKRLMVKVDGFVKDVHDITPKKFNTIREVHEI